MVKGKIKHSYRNVVTILYQKLTDYNIVTPNCHITCLLYVDYIPQNHIEQWKSLAGEQVWLRVHALIRGGKSVIRKQV